MTWRDWWVPAALLSASLPAAWSSGCSSVTIIGGEGQGGAGGSFIFLDGGPGGGDAYHPEDASFDVYEDPGCPDAGPPIYDFDCDPYNQYNGDCAPGEACYIHVEYPSDPCGQEIYGAYCYPAGSGGQGAPCGGGLDCQAGFVCVISGSGNQCIQLCHLVGEDGCPPGLVCEPIDVEGFGGCL